MAKKFTFTRTGKFKMTGEVTTTDDVDLDSIDDGTKWNTFLPIDLEFEDDEWEFEEDESE